MKETRTYLIEVLSKHTCENLVYSGKYGKIVVEVSDLDDRPRPYVGFRATRPDGKDRRVATLREALGFLEIPYEDGSLPILLHEERT